MKPPASPPTELPPQALGASDLLALLRPRHWIKNGFVAAPLLLTPQAQSLETVLSTLVGVIAFCAVASSIYVLNDYADREADREHPTKRERPLAAGTVTTHAAFVTFGLLLGVGLGLALWLSLSFALILMFYFGMNVAYSLGLKNVPVADVLVVALGFVLRVEAGAALIGVMATVWITVMTGLLAVFIALAKRRDDLIRSLDTEHRSSLEGYNEPFLDNAISIVLGALLVAYLIYTTDPQVAARMGTDQLVYTTPFALAGILRYLQIIYVEERSGNPMDLMFTDPGLIAGVGGWAVVFGIVIYG